MEGKPVTVYSFEDFRLDPARRLLVRGPSDDAVALSNKGFELLLLLVAHDGRLVPKDELMAAVWPNSFVEDSNLTQTISVLRKTLGENPNEHRFIVTEPGKGYRFVAAVTRSSDDDSLDNPVKAPAASRFRIPLIFAVAVLTIGSIAGFAYFWNRPSVRQIQPASAAEDKAIAVLPFRSVGSNGEDQLLGIGMADAIITKLSHIKSVTVRQTRSVLRYADSTPESIKIARELNVDAILEGTI